MTTYIDTEGLADDICSEIPDPLDTPPKEMADRIEQAVKLAINDRSLEAGQIAVDEVVTLDEQAVKLAAAVSGAPYIDRVAFLRAFVGALTSDALTDLHTELVRG